MSAKELNLPCLRILISGISYVAGHMLTDPIEEMAAALITESDQLQREAHTEGIIVNIALLLVIFTILGGIYYIKTHHIFDDLRGFIGL